MTGAAVKGAFTAGALTVLSDPAVRATLKLQVRRVYGASSGALNAAFYAAMLRVGEHDSIGDHLARVWIDDVTLFNAFSVSWRGIFGLRGLFDTRSVIALMRKRLKAKPGSERVKLGIVVTNAQGRFLGEPPHTSYEQILTFSDDDFDTETSLDRVRHAAAASASIPGLFVPMRLNVNGQSFEAVDGGVVDDTPLSSAIANAGLKRVFVITPDPSDAPAIVLRGPTFVSQVLDILIQQRLVRDLRTVRQRNQTLDRLTEILTDDAELARVLDAIGWRDHRPIEIVEIRPETPLPGQPFSGLLSKSLRQQYVNAGIDAARRVVAQLTTATAL